jgi:hypothetical protein
MSVWWNPAQRSSGLYARLSKWTSTLLSETVTEAEASTKSRKMCRNSVFGGRAANSGAQHPVEAVGHQSDPQVAVDLQTSDRRGQGVHVEESRRRQRCCSRSASAWRSTRSDSEPLATRGEHKILVASGDDRLSGTKFVWLQNPLNMSERNRCTLGSLKDTVLRTARAWTIKEAAADLRTFSTWSKAKKAWSKWYGWAIRSRLDPIKQVARMVKSLLVGILNAVGEAGALGKEQSSGPSSFWIPG